MSCWWIVLLGILDDESGCGFWVTHGEQLEKAEFVGVEVFDEKMIGEDKRKMRKDV